LTDARAYEALDTALDHMVQGVPALAPEGMEPLLQTARAAREAFAVDVPEDVARAHLAVLTGVPILEARRPRHRVALVMIAAVVTVLLLGGAAVAASGSALPGSLLYPVKRAVEKIDLALHRDPASQARLHLEFAQRRLTELSDLLALRRAGETVDIGAAMSAYQSEVAKVQAAIATDALDPGYQALLGSIDDQLQGHLAVLSALRDNTVPGPAQSAIQNAIDRAQTAQSAVSDNHTGEGPPTVEPAKTPSKRPNPAQSHSQSSTR
jgi:uncharacterized protein DUF5667